MFRDKRFGEYNSSISPEEKMVKRFALEQQVGETGEGALLSPCPEVRRKRPVPLVQLRFCG